MTRKIYKSAMGKTVDLGALMLENEHVRAVGNMNVNARGDILDGGNRVIEPKNRQVQRQYNRQSVVEEIPVTTSTRAAKKATEAVVEEEITNEVIIAEEPAPVDEVVASTPTPRGGLAAAIAKSQAVKQELMKTPRQVAQERAGVKKI